MSIITAAAALPVGSLAKLNGTNAAPTYKQCYWDRSHDWDNPNACYVEGDVDGFRTAKIESIGQQGNTKLRYHDTLS